MSKNETLAEIDDPKTRTKLESIQGYVLDIDQEIINTKKIMETKAIAAEVTKTISKRLGSENEFVQSQIDKGNISPEEAKIRISQNTRMISIVREFSNDAQSMALTLRGKLVGLEDAVKIGEKRFNAERGNWERHKRVEAEDAAELAEMHLTPNDDEHNSGKKTLPNKKKVSRKFPKRKKNK